MFNRGVTESMSAFSDKEVSRIGEMRFTYTLLLASPLSDMGRSISYTSMCCSTCAAHSSTTVRYDSSTMF